MGLVWVELARHHQAVKKQVKGTSMDANVMHTLTELQREQWAVDGYLQIEGALSSEEVELFSNELDRIRLLPGYEPACGNLPLGHYAWVDHADPDPSAFMDRRNLLPYHQAFIDLIDKLETFDLIVDIMGPCIQFSMSQAIVRPSHDNFDGYTHTDGGEGQRRIRVTETSFPLAVKVLYLLSDVSGTDCGNFTLFPGSHMRPFPEGAERAPHPHAPGAVQTTERPVTPLSFRTRSGTAPRLTIPAEPEKHCSTIIVRCSSVGTILVNRRETCWIAARHASNVCWAI